VTILHLNILRRVRTVYQVKTHCLCKIELAYFLVCCIYMFFLYVLSFSDFCVYREAKRREPLSHCLGIRDDVKISRSERKEDNCHSSIAECSCSTYRCSKVACGSHLPPAPVVSRKGVHIFLDLHHHNCILSVLL
jgi:hypothetical protein